MLEHAVTLGLVIQHAKFWVVLRFWVQWDMVTYGLRPLGPTASTIGWSFASIAGGLKKMQRLLGYPAVPPDAVARNHGI